ncbi:MAG TPA: hypothetical protein VHK01_00630, partial [Lacipirellulaceae bacterium]|nr:hypothetical protein [Lacipirellulaceae bacterium]
LFAFILLVSFGCTDGKQVIEGRTIVTGVVTYEGQPLQGGTITFTSREDPILSTTTSIRSGGKFRTDRAPTGKSIITVETESLHHGNEAAYIKIPAKYFEPTTSGIEVDLTPGENENVDIVLEAQPT